MELMKNLPDKSIDLTLTDIPYDHVNRDSNGLRKLDKGKADIITFNIDNFLNELYRITKRNNYYFLRYQSIKSNLQLV